MTKTYYAERPSPLEEKIVDEEKYVFVRENIEEETVSDELGVETTQYSADEYEGCVRKNVSVTEAVIERIKSNDRDKAAKEVREIRDKLLSESDKYVMKYYPNVPEELLTYRETLRDLPEQEGFPYNVEFPQKPEGVK